MTRIRKNLLVAGSIAATVLMAGSFATKSTESAMNIATQATTLNNQTKSVNENGIAAFSNLDSFDNDGFNNGVWQAANSYTASQGTDFEEKVSFYSDDGAAYVPLLEELFQTNSIVISAGFQVANAIAGTTETVGFEGLFEENGRAWADDEEHAFVLLDDSSLAATYTNAASISFAAEGAGFLAGVGAVVYAEYDAHINHAAELADANSSYVPNIVMWGGMPFPTVYDFMSGFAQAINWANDTYTGTDIIDGVSYEDVTLWSGGTSKREGISTANSYGGTTEDASTWYTFGFDAATGTTSGDSAKIKTDNAIANDASVVFPIAGGNTTVAEAELSAAADSTTRLIGVDADATMSSSKDELYLGTAAKNLETGGFFGLWAMDDDGTGVRNAVSTTATAPEFEGATYDSWIDADAGDVKGVQLRGTIDNGGVSFQYSAATGQEAGLNSDFEAALTFLGMDETSFGTLLETAQTANSEINAADDNFTNVPEAVKGDSNLTWLWITIGVIAALSIVGALVYFLVLKKN